MQKANVYAIHKPGRFLYLLHDPQLKGFLTWSEKKEIAILAFTTGTKAEKYAHEVFPERKINVYRVASKEAKDLLSYLLSVNINYMLIDLTSAHVDYETEPEEFRNYALMNIKKAFAKLT